MKTPATFTRIGLFGSAIVFVVVVGLSVTGLFQLHASKVVAAPHGETDELQIQLNNDGFTPSELQHSAGTFGIAVENAIVSGEYTLRLKAGDGTVVKEVQVQEGSAAWTVTLSAGEYTLTEASHPQWLCRIIVQ
jgi:hypothetical protein